MTQIAQLHNRKGEGDVVKRREGLVRTWLTEKIERTRERNLYFQLIGEMKGFIVQYIAHGERRPLLLAARQEQRLKVCVFVCVCVCLCVVLRQGADKKIVNTG